MAAPDTAAYDWSQLTSDRAEILEAYFALYQEREATSIGSGEITQWFRARQRTAPSESLIRTVLAAVDLPRRGGGRPSNESRATASASPPLTPVRPQTPRARKSPRG